MSTVDETLSLPPAAPEPTPAAFPLLATVAPLVAAGLIWMITGSAFALIFAVLSPLIAVSSMFDARRTGRKRHRREQAMAAENINTLCTRIVERHCHFRDAAWQRTPSAKQIALGTAGAARWRQQDATLIALGAGPVHSGIRLGGSPAGNDYRALREWAAIVTDAPIVVDMVHGLGIVGPPPLAAALARSVCVQLCFALPPTELGIEPVAGTSVPLWEWASKLPHRSGHKTPLRLVLRTEGAAEPASAAAAPGRLLVALATHIDDLPPGCGTVVHLEGPTRAQIIRSFATSTPLGFCPEMFASPEAVHVARALAEQAKSIGLVCDEVVLPDSVSLTVLLEHGGEPPQADSEGDRGALACPTAPSSLECVVGIGADGPVRIDLVASGPHAVVGGTTGSGKSELLTTWISALAATYSSRQVNFLLVDFKGGAAFQPLVHLPHCVGLITDLDANTAARAMASLGAELRYRERILSAAGARDVTDAKLAHPLPRLVIVVDEFATMLGVFPELHTLFVDIAARGRSLGVHLILCTQRPAGIVRDALLANCSLRLSLRVNNRADSQAVIGTDAAAFLAPHQAGRCLVVQETGEPVMCQVATTSPDDITRITARTEPSCGEYVARRPWLDPLAGEIGDEEVIAAQYDQVAVAGYPLGILDEPDKQRYRVFAWDPATEGHLLVVGAAGSGKTSLLQTIARVAGEAISTELIAADIETAWDALTGMSARVDAGDQTPGHPRLVLFDDFDSVCARWQPEHRMMAVDLLIGLLRDGPAAGLHVVVAIQRHTSLVPGLAALCPSVLLLKLPNLQEHLTIGGLSASYDPLLPPGGGVWGAHRVQVVAPAPALPALQPALVPFVPDQGTLLVVSSRPATTAALFRSRGAAVTELAGASAATVHLKNDAGAVVVVGDPDTWQSQYSLLARLRNQSSADDGAKVSTCLIFDRCTLSEFRTISHHRQLPPPLGPRPGRVWVLNADGTVTRGALPGSISTGA